MNFHELTPAELTFLNFIIRCLGNMNLMKSLVKWHIKPTTQVFRHKRRLSVELLNRRIKKDGLCFDNLKNFICNKNSINIAVREDGSKILL